MSTLVFGDYQRLLNILIFMLEEHKGSYYFHKQHQFKFY